MLRAWIFSCSCYLATKLSDHFKTFTQLPLHYGSWERGKKKKRMIKNPRILWRHNAQHSLVITWKFKNVEGKICFWEQWTIVYIMQHQSLRQLHFQCFYLENESSCYVQVKAPIWQRCGYRLNLSFSKFHCFWS